MNFHSEQQRCQGDDFILILQLRTLSRRDEVAVPVLEAVSAEPNSDQGHLVSALLSVHTSLRLTHKNHSSTQNDSYFISSTLCPVQGLLSWAGHQIQDSDMGTKAEDQSGQQDGSPLSAAAARVTALPTAHGAVTTSTPPGLSHSHF